MAGDAPLIVTSVHSRVVEDLADAVARADGGSVEVRTGLDATTWARARARGRVASLLIRVRGFLFPLRVDLGPRKSDRVIIATTNPFLLPAIVALRRPRARLVTLVYDLYPESLEVMVRLPRPLRAVIAAVTAFGLRRSAAVVFLGERTREYVVHRYVLTCPTAVIPPGCGELIGPSAPPSTIDGIAQDLVGKVVISYVGNLGSMHDAETLSSAIRQVLARSGNSCAVVVSARGDRAADLVEPLTGLPGVTVLGPLDHEEWVWVLHRTDISLASLHAKAGLVSLPSKLFASLAGGAAVFAVAPEESDLANLVKGLNVGLVVPPGEPELAAVQLNALIDDCQMRSRYADAALQASRRFTPARLSSLWTDLLAQVR